MKIYQRATTLSLALAVFLNGVLPSYAQDISQLCPKDSFSALCTTEGSQLGEIIARVITAILIIAVLIALFFLIWGGIKWVLSGGDKGKVEAARNTIIAAIVGLIITFLSFFILNLILQLFGLGSITSFKIGSIFGD